MTEKQALALIDRLRAKVKDSGGWKGPWVKAQGLTEARVGQWKARKAIPALWVRVLKDAL